MRKILGESCFIETIPEARLPVCRASERDLAGGCGWGFVHSRAPPSGEAGAPLEARAGGGRILAAAVLAAVSSYVLFRRNPAPLKTAAFSQLTGQPGQELYPSLSPDGNSFVYTSRASGNWDIYLQSVGGRNATNLTKDCSFDDTQPAFSPDGRRIAFRSERDGGGIFVMGATGESVDTRRRFRLPPGLVAGRRPDRLRNGELP